MASNKMDKILGPKYIGRINLDSLRGFVLDNNLTAKDSLLLNRADMEHLQFEYRTIYKQGMPDDFEILGVCVDEDPTGRTPEGRVVALLGDEEAERRAQDTASTANDYTTIYRCGNCGSVVDASGQELDGSERMRQERLLLAKHHYGQRKHVHGKCCDDQR